MGKFYVTTAIPYVNQPVHVGNALDYIYADTLARYHRIKGDDVVFSTGTDEHGGKNAAAAAAKGVKTQDYVDELSKNFMELCKQLDISYDRFIRTTDKQHIAGSQAIWTKLNPFIYKAKYTGMYDQKEEEFITHEMAKEIEKNDPERFKRLQPVEEENYFFKLSAFSDQIKKDLKDDSLSVVPATRRAEILSLIEQGLQDISISRPRDKISWGIPVPDDKNHVMYVWFEALMNYVTVLAYPKASDLKKYWPADVQIIGKDILRFHAAIWPAMLIALKLKPPKHIYAHGHVTLNGKTMSKSVGNVVSPLEIINKYGSDATRYYFLRHIPSYDDGDFSWEKMDRAYHDELGNELGNLVQRVANMIQRYQDSVIGDLPASEHDRGPYDEAIAKFRFDKALDYVFGLVKGLNQYIDEEQPWHIAEKDAEHLQEVLAYAAGGLIQIGKLLEPFLPKTGNKIQDVFNHGVINDYKGALFPKIEEPR